MRPETQSRDAQWFLAQLKPNSANVAERNLARQGFETFLPLEEETCQKNGWFATALRPLFPGYIFVSLDANLGLWRSVNSTHGVTRLVSFGAAPAPVPFGLLAALRARCDEAGKLLPPETFNPGDKVVLNTGPFAQFVAEVESLAPDQRVWVLIDLMGRQTRVSAAVDQLRVVE